MLAFVRFVLFQPDTRMEPKTILVYRTSRLGDFIVAIPALVTIRRRFPNAKIVLMTTVSTSRTMQVVSNGYIKQDSKTSLPWLSFIIPSLINEAFVLNMSDWQFGLAQAQHFAREFTPEMIFILPFSGEGGLSRIKKLLFLWRSGFRCPLYGWRIRADFSFMRNTQFQAEMVEHQVWGPLHAIMECPLISKIDESDITFHVAIDNSAETWVDTVWLRQGWSKRNLVVAIFPGGTFPHKRWPIEKFAHLCEILQKRYDLNLVILGAKTDQEWCNQLLTQLTGSILDLTGQTTLPQMAAILRRCNLFIGNDSGPAHLASAVECPCVTLTSSIQHPGFWEPWNSRTYTLRQTVSCQYCHSYTDCPEGHRKCIKDIDVYQAFKLCLSVLHEDREPHENLVN